MWVVLVLAVSAISAAPVRSEPAADPNDAAGPLDIRQVEFRQGGPELVFRVRTSGTWTGRQLAAKRGRYLCLQLTPSKQRAPRSQICVGARPKHPDALRLVLQSLNAKGQVDAARRLPATVTRPDRRTVEASFLPKDAGLAPGPLGWNLISSWSGRLCPTDAAARKPCADRYPDGSGTVAAEVRRAKLVGCERGGPLYRRHANPRKRIVALTFDDGPSGYTRGVLRALDRFDAKATFFVLGKEVSGREKTLRQMLAAGHEIGNHSFSHRIYPGLDDLRQTNQRIESATGFTPCLFRPPYGAVSRSLLDEARHAGLDTIAWDVDPTDWSTPGAAAIYKRVVGAVHNGAIVVMHDGGGNRSQTVAALPAIIKNLRLRGYRLVTVTEALGHEFDWRLTG